jgi:hypothetical protein
MWNLETVAISRNTRFNEKGKIMDNLMTVVFEAYNTELNHHRRYQITVGRDVLDDWTVSICYGRSGQRRSDEAIRQPTGR